MSACHAYVHYKACVRTRPYLGREAVCAAKKADATTSRSSKDAAADRPRKHACAGAAGVDTMDAYSRTHAVSRVLGAGTAGTTRAKGSARVVQSLVAAADEGVQ